MARNGVIETSTGDLIRMGYADFENDGNFDVSRETYMAGIPGGLVVRGKGDNGYSRWDGAAWVWVEDSGESILLKAKTKKNTSIDARTMQLMELGFDYDGEKFSLSQNAQNNALGIKVASDSGLTITPIQLTTLDDKAYMLADKASLDAWFTVGLTKRKEHLDSGRALKLAVNLCTTVAEVEAIVDNR